MSIEITMRMKYKMDMKCDSCGGKLAPSTTFECTQINASAEDKHYLIIEDIPTFECSQCGEKSFSPDVISSLERIRERNHPTPGQRVKIVKFD